jgi:hypothetical protein
MRAVAGQAHQIQVEMGSIEPMLAQRGKWDWKDVRGYLLPLLREAIASATEFEAKISAAGEQ